jgi:hypothetical protein
MTVPKFGETPAEQLQQVDEVRLYPIAKPAPVPLEPRDLPTSYGRNRLVLLPVDPYLIHVYWDLASTSPPAAGVRPILRFHESSLDMSQTRPFDVDVDFTTTSWYVNLWSPDKVYYADLGWRGEDGSFLELARSNTVRTPPAWPRAAEPAAIADSTSEAAPGEIAPTQVSEGATPPPDTLPSTATPIPAAPRADTAAQLNRRLAELFAIRGELPPLHEPVAIPVDLEPEIPGEPSQLDSSVPSPSVPSAWSGLEHLDLTDLSEERFTPGISSDMEGSFGK